MNRKEFVRDCAAAVCAAGFCCAGKTAEATTADSAIQACDPKQFRDIANRVDAARLRFSRLIEILETRLPEQERRQVFHALGGKCADTYRAALIDRYIALLFRLWEHGFNDRPFKFCFNFGVGSDGQLILLDLGELYFEKAQALERIHARHWEMLHLRDKRLNAYYRRAMEAAMTVANLEKYWGRAL